MASKQQQHPDNRHGESKMTIAAMDLKGTASAHPGISGDYLIPIFLVLAN